MTVALFRIRTRGVDSMCLSKPNIDLAYGPRTVAFNMIRRGSRRLRILMSNVSMPILISVQDSDAGGVAVEKKVNGAHLQGSRLQSTTLPSKAGCYFGATSVSDSGMA